MGILNCDNTETESCPIGCSYDENFASCQACSGIINDNNIIAVPKKNFTSCNDLTTIYTLTLKWQCPCTGDEEKSQNYYYAQGIGWAESREDLLKAAVESNENEFTPSLSAKCDPDDKFTKEWSTFKPGDSIENGISQDTTLTAKFTYTINITGIQPTLELNCTFDDSCNLPAQGDILAKDGQYNPQFKCGKTNLLPGNEIDICDIDSTTCTLTTTTCEKGHYCTKFEQKECPAGMTTNNEGASNVNACHYVAGEKGTQFCDSSGKCFTLPNDATNIQTTS